MKSYHWTAQTWGASEPPEDWELICDEANRFIDQYVAACPSRSPYVLSGQLWDRYCTRGSLAFSEFTPRDVNADEEGEGAHFLYKYLGPKGADWTKADRLWARITELAERYCPNCDHMDDGSIACARCNGLKKLARADIEEEASRGWDWAE